MSGESTDQATNQHTTVRTDADPLAFLRAMKQELINVEMLAIKYDTIKLRLDSIEGALARINGRVSTLYRMQYETDDDDQELQEEYTTGSPTETAEEESKRQHSAQKYSRQQHQQQMTT